MLPDPWRPRHRVGSDALRVPLPADRASTLTPIASMAGIGGPARNLRGRRARLEIELHGPPG